MLISYHWLKKFVDLEDISPQEIADKITLNLVEVESISQRGDDTILEIENKGITNRPDCFSQLGIAREVAAYFNRQLKNPIPALAKTKQKPTGKELTLKIKVQQPDLCLRYTAIVLDNISVKQSPKWLKAGVTNCGINSINNIVDITNYVMLELGQPLHAFDYDQVKDNQIIVRLAEGKEKITTFEGNQYSLSPDNLVIADSHQPLALAGIVGGTKAEISKNTKTIVLESANFDKVNNRKTEKNLKIRTEASTRFEKGLDPNLTLPALNRTVELFQQLAKAKTASPIIDVENKKVNSKTIKTSPEWINQFLGLDLAPQKMVDILSRLQLKAKLEKKSLIVTAPTYRSDLNMPADLAEEIARIYGYNNIPVTLPIDPSAPAKTDPVIAWRKKTKQFLAGLGFSEILSQPFVGKDLLETFNLNPKKHLQLINPLTVEQEYLRKNIIPSWLSPVKENLKNFTNLKLFEINRIFIPQGEKEQPDEVPTLALGVSGKNSYPILKGVFEALADYFGLALDFKPVKKLSFWHEQKTAKIINPETTQNLGLIGKIKSRIKINYNLKTDLSFAEINFTKLVNLAQKNQKTYREPSNYPSRKQDLTFVLPPKTHLGPVTQLIKKTNPLVKKVFLIDSFQNANTFQVTFQSREKTLTDEEVEKIRNKIVTQVEKEFKAKLKK